MAERNLKSRGLLQRFARQEPSKVYEPSKPPQVADESFNSIADEMYEQKEAHWAKRQRELEERLKFLAARKKDLSAQKDAIETAAQGKKRQTKPAEEMQLVLELSKAELKESHQTLQLERYKTGKLEEQLDSWRQRCEHLEKSNRQLTLMLVEKDKLVSNYLSELQTLRNQADRMGPDRKMQELIQGLDSVMARFEIDDEDIGEESKVGHVGKSLGHRPEQAMLKQLAELTQQKNRRIKELEEELELRNAEVRDRRVERQTHQALELNRKTKEQLDEKVSVIKKQQGELSTLRTQVRDLSDDYQDISGKYVKHVTKRQYEQQAEFAEFEDLKKTREEYEGQIEKLQRRHRDEIEELETDLKASRSRVLELIEEKAALDNDLFTARNELKALSSQFDQKERKITELMVSIQDLKQEASIARADKERAVEKMRDAQKLSDTYSEQVISLKDNLVGLRSGAADLEHAKNMLENEILVLRRELEVTKKGLSERKEQQPQMLDNSIQQAIRQLSSIILSKDKAAHDPTIKALVRNAFGEDFIHVVSTYEAKLREEQEAKEKAEDQRVFEMKKQLSCLSRLQEADETLASMLTAWEEGEFSMGPEEISAKKAEVRGRLKGTEQLIQGLKQTVTSSTDPLRKSTGSLPAVDVDDLKIRISSQATEIMSLKQTIRQLHDSDTHRSSSESVKTDKDRQRLTNENEMLKQELSKAMTSLEEMGDIVGKLQAAANTEDMALFLQCSAAVVEELIQDQVVADDNEIEDLLRDCAARALYNQVQ